MSATAADKRIAAIREKVRGGRARLSELNKQVGADLKKQMKPASHYLDDVEGFFPCAGSAAASAAFGKRMGKVARQC